MDRSNRKKLGDLAEIKHGFAFPGKHIVSQETDRILMTPGHFALGGGFRHNHKKYFNSSDYKDGYELESGDLVVTMTDLSKTGDTLGYGAVVPLIKNKIILHNQRIGKVVLKSAELDKNFCHYLLRSQRYRQHVLNTCTGSTVKHTSPTKILEYEFDLPPMSDQKLIAHILGTLDDKIELNEKINQTLEDIAKAIFKSWFVNFDPVRAKMEGRPTGLPPEIDELFPDELVDSEIGEIPKGWGLRRLDSLLELVYGKSLPAKDRLDGEVPVYGSGGINGFHNESLFDEISIVVGRKGTVGSLYWIDEPFFPIDTVFYVRTTESIHYCFYLMQTLRLDTMNTDAAVPGLNRDNAYRLQFPSAPTDLMNAFSEIAKLLKDRVSIVERENKILSQLRDTLLPKLISGELRIPDAEKFLEEAGI